MSFGSCTSQTRSGIATGAPFTAKPFIFSVARIGTLPIMYSTWRSCSSAGLTT